VPRASEAAFRAADKNGDGKLSMDEYIAARMQDFEAADRNKDGVLTRGEAQ
jgi:Ca2+-binding EF-hand superfamily protein